MGQITTNGSQIETDTPCSIAEFLQSQGFFPRSVVVEHNLNAVAPSEFETRTIQDGDRLEIVKIVAGG